MCADHNPDQIRSFVGTPQQEKEPDELGREARDDRGSPEFEDELVESEFTRGDEHDVEPAPEGPSRRQKHDGRKPLPKWELVDLDKVLPAPAIEAALRAAGIVKVHRPSTGFLTATGIARLAMISPIHVIRQDNVWHCILGWDLVREAREILPYPRMYPACICADMSLEELKESLIVERVGVPLRHQMSRQELNALAKSFLDVIARSVNLFERLGVDQWARIMGRKLRWLRYRRAKSKAGADHDE
ncbi:MAG TPA: hypothetical protein VMU57_12615 [Edaphobacter sp.]|uniref:hypothetical protein n=1 Tax=Edaphobacter sp. TaxID=1934404 RepID=UPI002CB79B6C|nr:hypothetical protein [Edaphobacter sp.]HUZ95744.1 hypothetical protein [Edaphobacter sp.]